MIWDHYRGLPATKFELKRRYKKCVHNYADAMKQLSKSTKFLSKGDIGFMNKYTREAINRVLSCDVELIEPPWTKLEANQKFLQANGEFNDLCHIIVEICNILSS
ncbi:pectinesterase inhibitor [Phtheirospermum japonicum]|uniref:Pectinesterase inhibitor n=1 Tax=Phtheirospermum japonicum TaxID=374723 RepID=A0A830CYD5_9LAMI|nr:pectinesterase inhibitor [Phtheirospermum japonicum]